MAFHPTEDDMYTALGRLRKIAEYFESKGRNKEANYIGKLSIVILQGWKDSIEESLLPDDELDEQPSSNHALKAKLDVNSQQAVASPKVDDDQEWKSGVSTIPGLTDIPTASSASNSSDDSLDDKQADSKQTDDNHVDEERVTDNKPVYDKVGDDKVIGQPVIGKKGIYGMISDKPVIGDKAFYTKFCDKPVSNVKAIHSKVSDRLVIGSKGIYSMACDKPVIDNKVIVSQIPKGNAESAEAGSLALVPAGYHNKTGNTVPYRQGQMTEGVSSPEQTLNSSENSKLPTETSPSPELPEAKAGVILIQGPFGHNFVTQVTSRIHEGPLQDIRMISPGYVKVVFQHASHARAFLDSNMEMKESLGSGRYGYSYDVKLVETIDWNDDLRRMNQPIRERRRLSFARKGMFVDHADQEKWKRDIYDLAGPGNVDFMWVFNNGNATAVFTSTLAARRVFEVFNNLSKGTGEYHDVSVTFSSDPCEKELVLAKDRGRPIRNNHRGNYRGGRGGGNGHRGKGFYSRGGGGMGSSSRTAMH